MKGNASPQAQQFTSGRAFLAARGFARNVRLVDVVAAISTAMTGNINANQRLPSNYDDAGAYAGPLDSNGNLPSNAMGVIVATGIMMPRRWVATEEAGIEQTYQQVAQDTSHIVHVAGTDVIVSHSSFGLRYVSAGQTGVATGPIYGIPGTADGVQREDVPALVVKPSERVQQFLYTRRALALSAETVTPELVVQMLVADNGND